MYYITVHSKALRTTANTVVVPSMFPRPTPQVKGRLFLRVMKVQGQQVHNPEGASP